MGASQNQGTGRIKTGGYWDGVEEGWPQSHPDGYGRLGFVRGTLDGTPLDGQFPIAKSVEKVTGRNEGQVFGKNAYATEGWCVSNRGRQATVTFATLGTHSLKVFDEGYRNEITTAIPGQTLTIELRAALNQDWNKADKGRVDIGDGKGNISKLEVIETGVNNGIFTGKYIVPKIKKGSRVIFSYGYLGFDKEIIINI
jgi:hypothetical protein